MMRYVTSIALLAAGLLVASGAAPTPLAPAASDWAWEPIGPVSGAGGMVAIATDPTNPKLFWVAGPTTVWVSDDGGASMHLVLQLSRAAGLGRATGSGDEVERDAPDPDEAPASDDDAIDDSGSARASRGSGDDEIERDDEAIDRSARGGDDDNADDGDNDEREVAFGITRLRPIGDDLWVCTSRGLWSVARAARQSGTGREARMTRRVGVSDVVRTGDGTLLVAADDGLWQLPEQGLARPVPGLEAGLAVNALAVSGGHVFVGSARGLYVGDGERFERVALSASNADAGIEDILIEPQGRVAIADGAHIRQLDPTGTINEETWTLPGTRRLAVGKDGVLWAAGSSGAWQFDLDAGWVRVVDGLFDRRLHDIAPSFADGVRAFIAGRAGAWRLVPETAHVLVGEASHAVRQALEGRPSADDAMRWADEARGVRQETVDDWTIEERLSWLLPTVELTFRAQQSRDEERLFIPSIDQRILDAVEVFPRDTELRILANWDVMPAIIAALESTRGPKEQARVRARKAQKAAHDRIIPLWESWAKKRVDVVTSEPKSVRDAVRDVLQLAQLEADLHALTGGRFPYEEPTRPAEARSPKPAAPPPE